MCSLSEPSSGFQPADLQQRPETAAEQGSRKTENLSGEIRSVSCVYFTGVTMLTVNMFVFLCIIRSHFTSV